MKKKVQTFNKLLLFCILSYINVNAQNFEWVKQFSNSQYNYNAGQSVTVDASKNVYTIGSFYGTNDFDPGSGVSTLTGPGIYISKLDSLGNFLWVKQYSNKISLLGQDRSIIADLNGNIYITGRFIDTVDFDPSSAVFNLISTGGIFISKLDPLGNFIWAKKIDSYRTGNYHRMTVDASGNVYLANTFTGTVDFDPDTSIFHTYNLTAFGVSATPTANYYINGCLCKLDSGGNFVWAKQLGIGGILQMGGLAVDVLGNVYTTGSFIDTADFDPNSGIFNLISDPAFNNSKENFFISKFDALGNLVWAKKSSEYSDNAYVYAPSLTIAPSGSVYFAGHFSDTVDFDPGPNTFNLIEPNNMSEIFVAKLDTYGNFVWAKQFKGGTYLSRASSIVLDAEENIYTTGVFSNTTDFDPGPGVFNFIDNGSGGNTFISKLDVLGNFKWAGRLASGPYSDCYGESITLDKSNNIYITGNYRDTVDFDPSPNNKFILHTPWGAGRTFILKLSQNSIVSSTKTLQQINQSTIYPNPTNGMFTLRGNGIGTQQLTVHNVLGQAIYSSTINAEYTTHDISQQPKGIYFYQLKNEGQVVKTGKIVVE